MKSLKTLIKLQKTYVDEQRQHLAGLQARLDEIATRVAELEIEMVREQLAAQQNQEAAATYGVFVKAAVRRGRDLEKTRQAASIAVDLARDKLSVLFEEQKRYEIALANRLLAEQHEENHRETIELDEVGSMRFAREKKE